MRNGSCGSSGTNGNRAPATYTDEIRRDGSGKTLTATEFLAALGEDERGLLFAVCEYPEVAAPEDHLLRIKKHIEEFKPTRVAVEPFGSRTDFDTANIP